MIKRLLAGFQASRVIVNHFVAGFPASRAQMVKKQTRASRGAHSPVRGHPRGSKVVPLNSWGRVSY